jgi:hypothetical protein
MRQSHVVVATVFATLAATAAVPAQTKPEAQSKPAAAQPAPALSSKPYSRLFDEQLPHVSTTTRRIEVRPNSARRFICAMPILPADSAIDPRFEMRPHDTTTQFSMHVVAPGQCQ